MGEPPLFLASSAFFAIKEAIRSARADAGASLEFRLDSPATSARIRMACEDHITKKVNVFLQVSVNDYSMKSGSIIVLFFTC